MRKPFKRLTIDIPPELHKHLRIMAAHKEKPAKEIILKIIEQQIAEFKETENN